MQRLIRKLLASIRTFSVPRPVILELTGRRNSPCHYCALKGRDFPGRAAHDLELEQVLEFLPRLRGAKALLLQGTGEPLLYRDLEKVIFTARKHVRSVSCATGGTLLTRDRGASLAIAGLSRLEVPLDSLDPGYHRRARGGDLEKIIANLECFSQTTGVAVRFSSTVTAENVDGLPEVMELKRRIPTLESIRFGFVDADHLEDVHGISDRLTAEAIRALKDRVRARSSDLRIQTDVEALPDSPAEAHFRAPVSPLPPSRARCGA